MRIAISGTHCIGKSTLIDEFLRTHKDFIHEPEPYTVLVEDFGEDFSEEPSVEEFQRQLEFNVERLKHHAHEPRVIYERCPIDFLAYIAVLGPKSAESVLDQVIEGMQHLDLIVYLPLDHNHTVEAEYPKLRKAVDRRLDAIYNEDEYAIISATGIEVIEATGSTAQRLHRMTASLTLTGLQDLQN
ncbi:MAG TPA: AAA family ATPase [Pyrinomonadaceae bacterium]|nr:AAA family ATPase [Pyrinomonadaceae bacterium]